MTYFSETENIRLQQENNPSLPFENWFYYKNKTTPKLSVGCATYPMENQIKIINTYWQVQKIRNVTMFLYGAYYDVRRSPYNIRIITMLPYLDFNFNSICQIWYSNNSKPVISKVKSIDIMWVRAWGKIHGEYPYLLTCEIPQSYKDQVPASVSVVGGKCDKASNNVRIIYNKKSSKDKDDFGVCVKGLSFLNVKKSVMLVEWLELLSLLGANKIHLYNYEVHPLIEKVLNYYKENGKISLTPLTIFHNLPSIYGLVNINLKKHVTIKRLHEVVSYNDCLYKNMYNHKYIALLDTDEVIMGINTTSWKALLENALHQETLQTKNKHHHTSFCARNVYFIDENQHHQSIPEYMYMLQRTKRTEKFTKPGAYVKCFHDTNSTLILHNHFPLKCLNQCYSHSFETDFAYMHHYRSSCHSDVKNCTQLFWKHQIEDRTVWQFKNKLIENVQEILLKLGFLTLAN